MVRFTLIFGATWMCAALMPAVAQISYSPDAQSSIFNSAIEVQSSIDNGVVDVQGPQDSAGPFNVPMNGGTTDLMRNVTSAISYADASSTGQGSLSMTATLGSGGIFGQGTITASALLTNGKTGGASMLTDGSADFDIYFTLATATDVTLDFHAAATDTLANPNNLAVVFLQSEQDFGLVLRAEASGTQSQDATWTGILPAGLYFLRGNGSFDELATTQFNGGAPGYLNDETFSFSLTTAPTGVPEPTSLALAGLGFAALAISRRRRERAA